MEFKVYRAKTVNDAITDALIELETTSDMIEYEVVEEGSAGLLGLFSRDAVVKVRRKESAPAEEEFSIRDELKGGLNFESRLDKAAKKTDSKKADDKKQDLKKIKDLKKTQEQHHDKPAETAPQVQKDVPAAAPEVRTAKNKVDKSRFDEARDSHREKRRHVDAREVDVTQMLKTIFSKLDIEAEIEKEVNEEEKIISFNVEGDDTGNLIGKRGQTLDAIQYLVSIIVNKDSDTYYRVKLDTNNYRERRQKTLENLAKNVASKVKKTRKKVALEPMNPYERRVIHSYLQSDKFVTTKSEGEEPNRRVVVYYKKS